MKSCSVCALDIESEDPAMIASDAHGNPYFICAECEAKLQTIIDGEDSDAVKAAMTYFADHINTMESSTVIKAIDDIING